MWAAAARDVSSQSPPPPSERHLSITDSIASTTVEEIKERYRLSTYDHPNRASNGPPRLPHARRDSIFSFNTNWTGDEALFGWSFASIPDTSRDRDPPNSAATYTDTLGYIHSPGPVVQSSAYSSSSHLPSHFNSRPNTGSNNPHSRPSTGNAQGLTVQIDHAPSHSDRIQIVTGPSPTSPAFKSSRLSGQTLYSKGLPTCPRSRRMSRQSVCLRRYPVPVRTLATDTATGIYTHNRPSPTTSEKVPGFPVVPPSPATAAFLREPVAPRVPTPPTKRDEHDGFSLEDPSEGRYASVHARDSFASTSYRDSLASSAYPRDSFQARHHPYDYSVEDLRTQTEDLEELEPPRVFFRRAPAATAWGSEAVPEVPKIPDAFRQPQPKRRSIVSTTTGVTATGTATGTGTGTEETGVVQHAVLVRTASYRAPAVYKTTDELRAGAVSPGGLLASPVSPNTLSPVAATAMMGQPPSRVRSPFPRSPAPHRRRKDLGSAHVRTTSRDLTMGGGGGDVRERSVVVREEDGDELVYVRGEDVDRERAGRESQYHRESQYTGNHNTTGTHSTVENRNTAPESRYDMRGSRYADSYLDSPYMAHWADLASPSEITPALRDSMINDTASYMRPGGEECWLADFGWVGPGGLLHSPAFPSPGGSLSTPGTPFRPPFATPSSAPATPGHGHGPPRSPSPDPTSTRRGTPSAHPASPLSRPSFPSSPATRAQATTQAPRDSSFRGETSRCRPCPRSVRNEETASNIVRKEGTMELPQLAHRAERLNEMLELGKLPHRSKSTLGVASAPGSGGGRVADVPVGVDQEGNDVSGEGYTDEKALRRTRTPAEHRQPAVELVDIPGQQHQRFNKLPEEHRQERKVTWGEGTGVPPPRPERTKTRRLPRKRLLTLLAIAGHGREPDAAGYTCPLASQTGQLCDLDATCACTSSLAGQCNPLAQVLVDLVGPVNKLFDPSPAFTPSVRIRQPHRIRTQRIALDTRHDHEPNSTERMQQFVKQLDFTKLEAASLDSSPAITWQSSAKPSTDQVALVSEDLRKALDRVYTFATVRPASSAQRSSALARYWTNTLQFTSSQLSDFRRIASVSPVLLPFDATSSAVRSLFSNVNGSFPPPAACYPTLSTDELNAVNAMETGVFGLTRTGSVPSALDRAVSRPVYGKDAPKQAVQVAANATSRVSVRLGRDGAGLPLTSVATANLTGSDDARTFGTISNMDHVLLTYLQAFPHLPDKHFCAVQSNLGLDRVAHPRSRVLWNGRTGGSRVCVCGLCVPSGELFFGSSAGDAFREWAVQRTGEVVWYDGAAATQVVREGRTRDSTFEDVWKGANGLLSNAETTGVRTSRPEVARIVNVFTTIGYMGS
ncbi:hypothetical protein RHS01_04667 [Rhizoctonia solani]|uniref:Uncharacterized protein n=1 Tax=Rhizoctonia solani TaxID=456999 RepID=A0A8H7IE45_9AGAM|nr:hypothetical protein RHS01_04667 [Rhizoctonia solani]